MLSPIPTAGLPFPAAGGKAGFNFVCLSGVVNLFQFIVPPQPGSVIGQLNTRAGSIPLVQSAPTPFGGPTLASVDRQFATLCGNVRLVGNQLALDVRFVAPGFRRPFGKFPFGKEPFGKGVGPGLGAQPFVTGGAVEG